MSLNRALSTVISIAIAAGTVSVIAPGASAAPDGSGIVINEVYGGGGNNGSVYSNDFVELFNPTASPIDVTGWTIEQRSAANNVGQRATLSGSVPARGYLLVQGAKGNAQTGALPTPDNTSGMTFSGTDAVAALLDASGTTVDLVGWGKATAYEGSPAKATSNATSVQSKGGGR